MKTTQPQIKLTTATPEQSENKSKEVSELLKALLDFQVDLDEGLREGDCD